MGLEWAGGQAQHGASSVSNRHNFLLWKVLSSLEGTLEE